MSSGVQSDEALRDVKQLGLWAAILSLGYVFWIVGAMEMVERLAYYGVKTVAALYAKDPVSKGGLGITMSQYGDIMLVWAFVQSLLPAFTGGLSDRYGYKQTIFVSTVVKILGYLTMAFFPSYGGFFAGAILLATGTAIFKPGIQGTLAVSTPRNATSVAWGIFYQTVNIGGFIGPILAGAMRKMAWQNVFFANAAVICLNFLLLLTYREPRAAGEARAKSPAKKTLWRESLQELKKTHVWLYLLVTSFFWFMFNALFDVLPAHIDDWVDTAPIVTALFGTEGINNGFIEAFVVLSPDLRRIQPEGLTNVNSAIIMFTCFFFAYLSGKMRPANSLTLGILLAAGAMFMCGWSALGWIVLAAIAIFSIGEMFTGPKFLEVMDNFAPPDKKAMYLGFSQISLAIGWTIEGKVAPVLYDIYASKDRFSRDLLAERGMAADQVAAIPQGEAFQKLVEFTKETPEALTNLLYQTHDVGMVWYIMGLIGVISAIGMYLYGRWLLRITRTS